jgi:hypothetical protein
MCRACIKQEKVSEGGNNMIRSSITLIILIIVPYSVHGFFDNYEQYADMFDETVFDTEWSEADGTTIETVMEAHAHSGGNTVGEGGEVITGPATAEVHVETTVAGTSTAHTAITVSATDGAEEITKHVEISGNATTSIRIETNSSNTSEVFDGNESFTAHEAIDAHAAEVVHKRRQPIRGIIQIATSLFSYVFSFFSQQ